VARKVITELICDVTGDPAEETIEFAYRGAAYKIDLSTEAAADFDAAVAGFVESAEKLGKATGTQRKARSTAPGTVDREQNQAIREWARRNGHDVKDRGRIPAETVEAYHQAGGRTLTAVG
jgi:hypothetical protein